MTPEICLWRAVILEQLWTACGEDPPEPQKPTPPERWSVKGEKKTQEEKQYRYYLSALYVWRKEAKERASARKWLLDDRHDFMMVCQFAGWDPANIRERARSLALAGWPRFVSERPDFAAECAANDVDDELEEAA